MWSVRGLGGRCPGFRWEAWSGQPLAHGRSSFGAALACFELIPAAVLLRFCESAAGFREVFLKLAALGMVVRLLHMGSRTRFHNASVSVDTLDNPQLQLLLCLRSACANATEIRC